MRKISTSNDVLFVLICSLLALTRSRNPLLQSCCLITFSLLRILGAAAGIIGVAPSEGEGYRAYGHPSESKCFLQRGWDHLKLARLRSTIQTSCASPCPQLPSMLLGCPGNH